MPTNGLDPDSSLSRPDSPEAWQRLIEAIGPASMLVAIRKRMGAALLSEMSPEDIWQETLLHAWRDRASLEWRGLTLFRQWLLGIAFHRITDAVKREGALKRGDEKRAYQDHATESSEMDPWYAVASTTPSRLAVYREQALAMDRALEQLPQELAEVVRARLFEGLSTEETARTFGIGISAVKHRLRKGAALYRQRLREILGSEIDRKSGDQGEGTRSS
ncbi:MAG: RNA polymerase sigma factor [Planctomycetota bacterium]